MRIVGGIWANVPLTSPGQRVRPTQEEVRAEWMTLLAPHLRGARVLDLFAGSGALGLEALSRGAASVDFVENGDEALHALKANVLARKLKAPAPGKPPTEKHKAARIFKQDALPYVERLPASAYDLAFADPPYESLKAIRIVERWQRVPFAPILVLEHPVSQPVPKGVYWQTFEQTCLTIYSIE